MPRKKKTQVDPNGVRDFRHAEARRKNNPPAGVASTYEVRKRQSRTYAYDPHLDPQLQWASKAERTSFEVDVVSLHIHERISTKAILRAVRRAEPVQLDLFGETLLSADYGLRWQDLCQAFFPSDDKAWDKLQRALKAQIDAEAFEKMQGTVSFPFQPGEHKRIAVKVIDFRGNEVVRVINLAKEAAKYGEKV